MEKIKAFFEDVRKEMKKVSWPSQKELRESTTVTVFFSILLAVFIFAVDRVYSTILEVIYK